MPEPALRLTTSAKSSQVGQPGVRARIVLPSTLAPGQHTVTARLGTRRASTKVRVYQSVVTLSATSITVSRSAVEAAQPRLSGSVVYQDEPATRGYVDLYRDGATAGGRSSPAYLLFATVQPTGTFDLEARFATAVAAKYAPGSYSFQAFYAQGTSFADYVVSTPITVIVTP